MNPNWVSVRVYGDFACFTRPENKMERVSYPIITPSAARGVLEAIFWHPQFEWRVREIRVYKPVRTMSILRNEVESKMSASRQEPYFADRDRTQRNAVILRDVDYGILAEPVVRPGVTHHPQKYREQFRRRVARGQCFHRPALGCREFPAEFEPFDETARTVEWSEDLGLMLWDLKYAEKPPFLPLFFHAVIKSGVIEVPEKPLGDRL